MPSLPDELHFPEVSRLVAEFGGFPVHWYVFGPTGWGSKTVLPRDFSSTTSGGGGETAAVRPMGRWLVSGQSFVWTPGEQKRKSITVDFFC